MYACTCTCTCILTRCTLDINHYKIVIEYIIMYTELVSCLLIISYITDDDFVSSTVIFKLIIKINFYFTCITIKVWG